MELNSDSEQDLTNTINIYLEKLTLLKKNFMINHYEVEEIKIPVYKDEKQQEIEEEEEEDVKSISTDVSIYEIVSDLQQLKEPKPYKPNNDYTTNYNLYLRKLMKIFKQLRSQIINQKGQLSLRNVEILIELFVTNYILIEEIHILLKFFMSLLDVKKKSHYFLEDGFFKLFYDFLLRLNFQQIDEVIYYTIEQFIIFINCKLKILVINNNQKFELLQQSILGYDYIFDICINTNNQEVKNSCQNFLLKIFQSQMNYRENFATCISIYYYNMIYENLFDYYSQFGIKDQRRTIKSILQFVIVLIEEIQSDKIKMMEQNQMLDSIIIQVIDQRIQQNQNSKRIMMKVFLQDKLIDLKNKIEKKFWLDKSSIKLLSKGKFLLGDKNTLQELQIVNRQTIMILEKQIDEDFIENNKKKEIINVLMEMFPNFNYKILEQAYEKKQNLEDAIIYLTDNIQEDKIIEKEFSEKNIFNEKSFKQIFINKLSSDEFFALMFQLEQINDNSISFLIWKIINSLPPNYLLSQNIKKKIFQLTPQKIQEIIQTIEQKTISKEKQKDYFEFNFQSIFNFQHPIDCYKFRVFTQLISIFSMDQELSQEQQFSVISVFISHQGIKLLSIILKEIIKKIQKKELNQFFMAIVPNLINSLKGFIYSYYLLKQSDPFKEVKKLIGSKPWSENFNFDDSVAENNSSIDNVFLQKQIGIQRGQKSPLSYVTPNFRSPIDSRSISGKSMNNPQKNNFEKEDISFSVFTNVSGDSYRLETMNLFLKKIQKEKEIQGLLFKSFEEISIIEMFQQLSEEIINNYDNDLSNSLQIIFEIFLVLQKWEENINYQLSEDYFMKLYCLIDNQQNYMNTNFEKMIQFFIKILKNECFFKEIKLISKYEKLLKNIFNYIFDEKSQSINSFLLLIQLIERLNEVSKFQLKKFLQNNFPEVTCEMALKLIYKLNVKNEELQNISGYLLFLKTLIKLQIYEKNYDLEQLFFQLLELLLESLFKIDIEQNLEPTLKFEKERKNAFSLILTFCNLNQEFQFEVIKYLSKIHRKNFNKQYGQNNFECRQLDQFVGLKNLKNTCYLNSVIQQLYYSINFREQLLEKQIDEKDYESFILFKNLQNLFANLKSTQFKSLLPIEFCKNFTAFDGMPLNPNTQQDANEFFNLLLDNISTTLEKNKENENLVKNQFQGILLSKIQSRESDFNFEKIKEEAFMGISLNIKTHQHLNGALDEYTRGVLLDGDNKYYCEDLNKKITVIKKYEFKKLPNYLVFTLNRFEFNYELGQRVKLNDYFEFPFELNMNKWMHNKDIDNEFVNDDQQEKIDQKDLENDKKYNYELQGVLVHSGIAESGHYYSYIKIKDKWYEFNDLNIRQIDIDQQLTFEDWFSGIKKDNMFTENNFDWPANRKNAYMIFYKKVEQEIIQEKPLHQKLLQQVQEEDFQILISKLTQDPIYQSFLRQFDQIFSQNSKNQIQLSIQQFDQKNIEEFIHHNLILTAKNYFVELTKNKESPFDISFDYGPQIQSQQGGDFLDNSWENDSQNAAVYLSHNSNSSFSCKSMKDLLDQEKKDQQIINIRIFYIVNQLVNFLEFLINILNQQNFLLSKMFQIIKKLLIKQQSDAS